MGYRIPFSNESYLQCVKFSFAVGLKKLLSIKIIFMKRKLFVNIGAVLVTVLILSSCKKEAIQLKTLEASTTNEALKSASYKKDNECRLTYLDWPGSGTWQFHYNSKGLADKWSIDYGFGLPVTEETLFYDNENRLIRANEVYFSLNYVYLFTYKDKRISSISRSSVEFPDEVQNFQFTYNKKGQNIRQDDVVNDQHILMFYDARGNCTKTDTYIGTDLWISDNYQFDATARNPRLNVPGIELGFPFYGGTFMTDKNWFISNRTLFYESGIPYMLNDYDPSKTTITTGNHNFPSSALYYDAVSEADINITFGYKNCNGAASGQEQVYPQNNLNAATNKNFGQRQTLLFRSSAKSLKERIQQLRRGIK